MVKRTQRELAKAHTRDNMTAFAKLARPVDGSARIVDQSPLIVPIDVLAAGISRDRLFDSLQTIVRIYVETLEVDRRTLVEQYELTDFARKVVGVGSVGTRSWIALMLGRDHGDPLFLQVKEAQASVLEDLLPRSQFDNHGRRVVAGQRLMQASSDILLGWLRVQSDDGEFARDFYVRQLRDWKGSAPIDEMPPDGMFQLRTGVRLDAGASACPQRRSSRDRRISGQRHASSIARCWSSPTAMPSRTSVTTQRSPTRSKPAG